ncbi:MAG: winged helix-turn-helix transcriptional regulator [Chroococcidiopsidaceae cyanobacterium CP_BM_ER_R8_30]|nr:winged helix-turn-helix transcriptional regulator [Chroococcidiopsidaceae cyanobacterium CP_BM_ER_R8_30]
MIADPDFSSIATLIADPSRAAMLAALLGGQTLPATELAHCAQISPQTASTHLNKLVAGHLVTVKRQGRHRYYCLASSEVATVLETLATLAPASPVRSFQQSQHAQAIRQARTCYDHLAGQLGVELTRQLVSRNLLNPIEPAYQVTAQGEQWFNELGIDLKLLRQKRRALACQCLDWSERHYHLAGALGAALQSRWFELAWIQRIPASRAVRITEVGRVEFFKMFGIRF